MFAESGITGDIGSLRSWNMESVINIVCMFAGTEITGNINGMWKMPKLRSMASVIADSKIVGDYEHINASKDNSLLM